MQTYDIAFARLGQFFPFLHIVFSMLFLSCQLICIFFSRYLLLGKKLDYLYDEVLKFLRLFLYFCFFCIFLCALSGFLTGESDIKSADPMANAILTTKYSLAAFLFFNLIYMAYCYKKATKALLENEFIECHENIVVIVRYFAPLNIVILLFSTYLGVAYRDFYW